MMIELEYKYIWMWRYAAFAFNGSSIGTDWNTSSRAPLWSPKWLYFLTRYYGIIAQVCVGTNLSSSVTFQLTILCPRVHFSLVQKYLNSGPVQPHQCRAWFIFLASSTTVLVAAFDTVLLLRGTRIFSPMSTAFDNHYAHYFTDQYTPYTERTPKSTC